MLNIEDIISELRLKEDLNTNLDLLVIYCIENLTLAISNELKTINYDILINENILTHTSSEYNVTDNLIFAYKFYKKYSEILDFRIVNDFTLTSIFLKEIDNSFNNKSHVKGFTTLERNLWIISILDSHKRFNSDFLDFLKTLKIDTDSSSIYAFNEGFSKALPLLNIPIQVLYEDISLIYSWIKSDVYYNMPIGALRRGIRNKMYDNEEFGINFFDFLIIQEKIEVNILSSVISGLFDKLRDDFFEKKILPMVDNEKYSVSIICGLSNIQKFDESEVYKLLNLYEKFNIKNVDILINIPQLLISILKNEVALDKPDIKTTCFDHLEKLVTYENSNLISYILHEIRFLERFTDEKVRLLIKLIEQPHFKLEQSLNQIDQLFINIKDINSFEKILFKIGECFPFQSIKKDLHLSINDFKNNFVLEFEELLIRLLINNKANYRFLGQDLFNELSFHSFKFTYNILALNPIQQFKLWVSILQNYREPQYVIPCLLPLINSKSPLVREAFICKLEEYSENYGCLLIELIENSLNLEDLISKQVSDRIKKHYQIFFENQVFIKHDIKELNPFYTQNKIFTDYMVNYNREFSRQLQKTTTENSIMMQLCTKVTLAKGGGWINEENNSISKLGKFSSSFSLPRCYFIDPEHFDFERILDMKQDWDNCFDNILTMLENEQQ